MSFRSAQRGGLCLQAPLESLVSDLPYHQLPPQPAAAAPSSLLSRSSSSVSLHDKLIEGGLAEVLVHPVTDSAAQPAAVATSAVQTPSQRREGSNAAGQTATAQPLQSPMAARSVSHVAGAVQQAPATSLSGTAVQTAPELAVQHSVASAAFPPGLDQGPDTRQDASSIQASIHPAAWYQRPGRLS